MLYQVMILLILLFLSAFFSGSETSLFSLSKISVRRLKLDKVKNSNIVDSLLNKPTDLLITILIGNMFANVFASGMAASFTVKKWGEGSIAGSIIVMTVIVVIFCEIMPKIIAIKNAKRISLLTSPFIQFFSQLFFPLRWFLSGLAKGMLSFVDRKVKKIEPYITKDELESAIKVGYSKIGILGKGEAEMMEDVLELSDKKVKDVMVQEKDIVSFSVNMPTEEMGMAIKEAELSRIPVFEQKKANVIGILYAKDLLKKRLEHLKDVDIKGLLRGSFYVMKDMRLSLLLREFRTRKTHLALVKDEKGNLVGLVTLEDLLEEIIGDIHDKEALIQRISKRLKKGTAGGTGFPPPPEADPPSSVA